jgi:hypothetical protein
MAIFWNESNPSATDTFIADMLDNQCELSGQHVHPVSTKLGYTGNNSLMVPATSAYPGINFKTISPPIFVDGVRQVFARKGYGGLTNSTYLFRRSAADGTADGRFAWENGFFWGGYGTALASLSNPAIHYGDRVKCEHIIICAAGGGGAGGAGGGAIKYDNNGGSGSMVWMHIEPRAHVGSGGLAFNIRVGKNGSGHSGMLADGDNGDATEVDARCYGNGSDVFNQLALSAHDLIVCVPGGGADGGGNHSPNDNGFHTLIPVRSTAGAINGVAFSGFTLLEVRSCQDTNSQFDPSLTPHPAPYTSGSYTPPNCPLYGGGAGSKGYGAGGAGNPGYVNFLLF